MFGELFIGFAFVAGVFLAFLILTFFSVRRIDLIKRRGLKTLRGIKRELARNGKDS